MVENKRHHHHTSRRKHHDSKRRFHRHNDEDDTQPCPTFDAVNLNGDLLKGIYAYGFEKPSAIQRRAIRPIIRGRDVIAQSQSGTGKTAVFSIAALQLLDESSRETQVMVLSPTHELAEQTCHHAPHRVEAVLVHMISHCCGFYGRFDLYRKEIHPMLLTLGRRWYLWKAPRKYQIDNSA